MRAMGAFLVMASAIWLAGCGSSNSNGSSSISSVTATCSPSTVQSGQTSQCTATVTGTGNFSSAVSWSATAGSISSSGLFTAPTVSSNTPVTITATSTQDTSMAGTAVLTVTPGGQASNVQPIVVDAGPQPQTFFTVDQPFTSVTVCVPGTGTCQTVDHVLVDTGSSGLRLLSAALTISLPQQTDSGGNPLDECNVFLDGFTWGPVAAADIKLAGETASSARVQVIIPSSASPGVPSSCSSQGMGNNEGDDVSTLGANGILGVGLFQQDCGGFCVTNSTNPSVYFICPASGCTETTVPLTQQVPNPVTMFAGDNNGVLLQLPAVSNGGASNVGGSLIFGIGTQANNDLGSATVYSVPDAGNLAGNIITTFNGKAYNTSFIDSGSNGIFFLDSSTTGISTCASPNDSWYCPSPTPQNLTATNQGQDSNGAPLGNAVPVNFTIEDANALFKTNNTAFSTLSGPNPGSFDWGLAFFFGRNVFTAIENMSTPGGTGPYVAY